MFFKKVEKTGVCDDLSGDEIPGFQKRSCAMGVLRFFYGGVRPSMPSDRAIEMCAHFRAGNEAMEVCAHFLPGETSRRRPSTRRSGQRHTKRRPSSFRAVREAVE